MITRHYFMYAVKYHEDGTGSFSYNHCEASHKSWLPDPLGVMRDMHRRCEEALSEKPGKFVAIQSFNRV